MYVYTVTRKSIGHIGFFKKLITSLVATNLKFELNIVHILDRLCMRRNNELFAHIKMY